MELSDKKTILVVDDMATILEHAKQILKDDYRIIPCISAIQALDVVIKRRPDIILSDINMPEMDGFEFLSRLKENPEFKDIPVILITSEITSEMESKGFEMGAADFIIKPFTQIAMTKRITNQLLLANK